MNKNVEEVLGDIDSIKSTIDDSKTQYKGLYQLSIIFGSYNLIRYFLILLTHYTDSYSYIQFPIFIALDIAFIVSYLRIYKSEKKYMNSYYLSILNIWGFFVILLPIITRVISAWGFLLPAEIQERIQEMNTNYDFYILLFAIYLITCSYILKNRKYVVFAVISILLYYAIHIFFYDVTIQIGNVNDGGIYVSFIYNICINLMYILMGLVVKKRVDYYEEL